MKEVMVHIYRKIKQISSPFFRSYCLVTFKKSRPRWQVAHFQFLLVFQDGGHVKFPTLGQRLKVKIPTQGKACSVNFPWVARTPPPPPWGLTLIGALVRHCLIKKECYLQLYNNLKYKKITLTVDYSSS